MEVKLIQISAVRDDHNVYVFGIDENGKFWQWMRGAWGRMKNPFDDSLKMSEPGIKTL